MYIHSMFYMQKLIIANDDGSFAWGWEGNFFGEYRGLHSEFAQKLQSFYYAQDNKMIYNILQSIWISLQILVCFFAMFFDNRNKRALFIAMTLTGINLFLMIFEVFVYICSVLYYSGYAWPFLYAGKSQDDKR